MENKKNEKFYGLEEKINDYFLYCDAVNEKSEEIVKPYTLSGLLYYIGLTRAEFEKLAGVKRYQRLISSAKAKIEAFIEENALTGEISVNASANSLKYNFGWGEKPDKHEEVNNKTINVVLSPEMTELAK